jgi:hypothetical protein
MRSLPIESGVYLLVAGLLGAGCKDASEDDSGAVAAAVFCQPDESAAPATRESYDEWIAVRPPGAECSDGSPYKFFVNYSSLSNNLVVTFEPGGACWDFESCSGMTARGAANPNGIADNHMDTWQHVYPSAGGAFGADGEFATWNKVFIPYCTGDVYAGSRTVSYTPEDGGDSLEFRHVGYDNMVAVTEWLADTFETVPRMMVTGCSAGGVGAFLHYPLLRDRMSGVECAYLLNDSGPIFPHDGPSGPLQDKIATAWNTDRIIDAYGAALGERAADRIRDDFGAGNAVFAEAFPQDRLAFVGYRRDLNYSLYSYDSFYDSPPYETIVANWEADLAALREQYAEHDNASYFIPYYRDSNCSHCATIIPTDHLPELIAGTRQAWDGTEIEETGATLRQFISDLMMNEEGPGNHFEEAQDDGEFSDEAIAECRQ